MKDLSEDIRTGHIQTLISKHMQKHDIQTKTEFARILGVSESSVRAWIKRGKIPLYIIKQLRLRDEKKMGLEKSDRPLKFTGKSIRVEFQPMRIYCHGCETPLLELTGGAAQYLDATVMLSCKVCGNCFELNSDFVIL